jgi:pyruvate ferredoxin oxidoreductase gamma subunit
MEEYIEIRWHGRGGQGTVTAAKLLAQTVLRAGKYVQAFPEYGPEREGAPLRAFNRISNNPIIIHTQVTEPNIVVVVDKTLLESIDVTEGLRKNGILVINLNISAEEIRKKLKIDDNFKICQVDANKISFETLGKIFPNTPMLGALLKITNLVNLDVLLTEAKETFSKKFNEKVLNANLEAIKRAYNEATIN